MPIVIFLHLSLHSFLAATAAHASNLLNTEAVHAVAALHTGWHVQTPVRARSSSERQRP